MQHITLGPDLKIYHDYLQSDHDFKVWAEVLTLEEVEVASVDLLDGQVNFQIPDDGGPDRTASVVLSDPDNALRFGTTYAEDPTDTLWVDRLLRIMHEVTVPGIGDVTTTCFVGVPTSAAVSDGTISLELGDKSLLADHGVAPRTYRKKMNVRSALINLLYDLTGERKFRIPATKKKLSKSYSVGMGEDSLTPWECFKKIAEHEMNWRAFYSADGYATCEAKNAKKRPVYVHDILALPDSSTSFTDFINYVKVTSHRKFTNKAVTRLTTYKSVTRLPRKHRLSAESLGRNGANRLLPLTVDNNNLKNLKAVADRAKSELADGSDITRDQALEIIPLFHLDRGDKIHLPEGIGEIGFNQASIPLGVGGNMTIGAQKWVSRPVHVRRARSKKTVKRKRKKGGKKSG